jgi:Ca-activated chloride channel family protein
VQVRDIYPRSVKDIFQGSQVLLLGKYKGGGNAKVNVTGKVNGVARSFSFPLSFAVQEAAHTYLPRLWAMRRIGYLTEVAKANGDNREVVDEIVALSKKHGIISAYTSFLATDPNEGRRLAQPTMRVRAPGISMRRNTRAELTEPMAMPAPAAGASAAGAPADEFRSASKGFVASHLMGKKAEFSSSLRQQLAAAPYSGALAVAREKEINKLKTKDVVQEREGKASGVKWIEGKTFYLRDGFWTDSAVLEGTHPKEEVIEFGSAKYFELVRKHPGVTKFLGAGAKVIVLFEGRCLKIVAP